MNRNSLAAFHRTLTPSRKEIRKFVPGRMHDVVLLGERFEKPEDFDPRAHFSGSVGVMTGGGDYEVVIEMDAWLTDVLRGRKFHPKQIWQEVPGGGSQLRMRLNTLAEIEQYVLSWGTRANVIGPVELRERIRKTGEELAKRYAEPETRNGHE